MISTPHWNHFTGAFEVCRWLRCDKWGEFLDKHQVGNSCTGFCYFVHPIKIAPHWHTSSIIQLSSSFSYGRRAETLLITCCPSSVRYCDSSQEWLRQFGVNLTQTILEWKGFIHVCSNEGQNTTPRGDYSKKYNFSWATGSIWYNLHTNCLWVKNFRVVRKSPKQNKLFRIKEMEIQFC